MIPTSVVGVVSERCRGACEARCTVRCTGGAEQLHHRRMRSQGGGHTVANLLFVCHACHAWIHAQPGESYRRGLLVHSWDAPECVEVVAGVDPF